MLGRMTSRATQGEIRQCMASAGRDRAQVMDVRADDAPHRTIEPNAAMRRRYQSGGYDGHHRRSGSINKRQSTSRSYLGTDRQLLDHPQVHGLESRQLLLVGLSH